MFFSIFERQNSTFEEGIFFLQRGHPCQKQPSKKMAVRFLGNIMSGLPGSLVPVREQYPSGVK
jgi:hypothetical protein